MKTTINVAPYTVELETVGRITYAKVMDEFGKQAASASYFLKRWCELNITVEKVSKVQDVLTVLEVTEKQNTL